VYKRIRQIWQASHTASKSFPSALFSLAGARSYNGPGDAWDGKGSSPLMKITRVWNCVFWPFERNLGDCVRQTSTLIWMAERYRSPFVIAFLQHPPSPLSLIGHFSPERLDVTGARLVLLRDAARALIDELEPLFETVYLVLGQACFGAPAGRFCPGLRPSPIFLAISRRCSE
jgi:hypothetical protein